MCIEGGEASVNNLDSYNCECPPNFTVDFLLNKQKNFNYHFKRVQIEAESHSLNLSFGYIIASDTSVVTTQLHPRI